MKAIEVEVPETVKEICDRWAHELEKYIEELEDEADRDAVRKAAAFFERSSTASGRSEGFETQPVIDAFAMAEGHRQLAKPGTDRAREAAAIADWLRPILYQAGVATVLVERAKGKAGSGEKRDGQKR